LKESDKTAIPLRAVTPDYFKLMGKADCRAGISLDGRRQIEGITPKQSPDCGVCWTALDRRQVKE
jgi:hypothetical protein